jgi:hypothetical protein
LGLELKGRVERLFHFPKPDITPGAESEKPQLERAVVPLRELILKFSYECALAQGPFIAILNFLGGLEEG